MKVKKKETIDLLANARVDSSNLLRSPSKKEINNFCKTSHTKGTNFHLLRISSLALKFVNQRACGGRGVQPRRKRKNRYRGGSL